MSIFLISRPSVGYTVCDEIGPDGLPTESGYMAVDIYAGTVDEIQALALAAQHNGDPDMAQDMFESAHVITLAFHVSKLPPLASTSASYWPSIVSTLFAQMYPGIEPASVQDLHAARPTIH